MSQVKKHNTVYNKINKTDVYKLWIRWKLNSSNLYGFTKRVGVEYLPENVCQFCFTLSSEFLVSGDLEEELGGK